jgi:membrane-bound serine protease (ClpP class)
MADPYTKLTLEKDGIQHDKSSPLTLSAAEAKKLNVVDFIASDQNDLIKQLGLQNCRVVEFKHSLWEQVGSFLAFPAIAGILLVVGLVGVFVEVKSPGFGVPGTLGLAALTLFFLGHMANGSSAWGPIVIFFVGLLLLALEIFVIPGFGLIGILGIFCMLISFFAAFGWENINTAAQVVTLSLIAAIVLMILLAVYVLPKSSIFRKSSLHTVMTAEAGFKAAEADSTLIGSGAVTVTPLRPSGVIVIDGQRYDAASDGDFLESGETVEVVARSGFQLVVRRKNV